MTFWGMDLEQVRGHADGLAAQAQQLEVLIGQIDGAVDQAGWVWPGPDSDAFRDAWHSSYRSSLDTTARDLADAVMMLYREIEEQAAASGEDFPGGSYAISGSIDEGPWFSSLAGAFPWVKAAWGSAGLLATLGANSSLIGRYGSGYRDFAAMLKGLSGGRLGDDFFRYKGSLNGFFHTNGLFDRLDKLPGFGLLQKGTGAFSLGWHLGAASDSSLSTSERIYAGADAVGDGLKMSRNPVAYLSGVIVSTGGMIGQEAQKTDWSGSGFSMAWNYATEHPADTAMEFVKSIPNVLGSVL